VGQEVETMAHYPRNATAPYLKVEWISRGQSLTLQDGLERDQIGFPNLAQDVSRY